MSAPHAILLPAPATDYDLDFFMIPMKPGPMSEPSEVRRRHEQVTVGLAVLAVDQRKSVPFCSEAHR